MVLVNWLLTKLTHNEVHFMLGAFMPSTNIPPGLAQRIRLREQDEFIWQWTDLILGMSDSLKGTFYLPLYAFLFSSCMWWTGHMFLIYAVFWNKPSYSHWSEQISPRDFGEMGGFERVVPMILLMDCPCLKKTFTLKISLVVGYFSRVIFPTHMAFMKLKHLCSVKFAIFPRWLFLSCLTRHLFESLWSIIVI